MGEAFFAPTSTDQISYLVAEYRGMRARIEHLSQLMQTEAQGVLEYFIAGNSESVRLAPAIAVDRLFALEGAVAELNAGYWNRVLAMTDVFDLMPQARRQEWADQILGRKAPEFEEATVRSTLADLLSSRARFFAERVDGVFRELSGTHLTNRPEGFGKRMIISGVLDKFSYVDHGKAGYINDLRAVIARYAGRDEPRWNSSARVIEIARDRGRWVVLDGGALRLRVFKGAATAHLEVHPDVSWRLNQTLSSLYPTAIPSALRTAPKKVPKSFATLSTTLPFAVTDALADVVRKRSAGTVVSLPLGYSDNGKAIRKEVAAVLKMLGGTPTRSLDYEFSYDPQEALEDIVATGQVPERTSHQFFPTPEGLAREAVDLACIEDGQDCLEPSAGLGALADHMPKDQTLCVEISTLHAAVLKAKGFQVESADFLAWAHRTSRRFDRIVMNPPFANGRARHHLDAAAGLLRPGGRLVAILPGSLRGKDLLPGFDCQWHGPYQDQFQGTGVTVAMLVAQCCRA